MLFKILTPPQMEMRLEFIRIKFTAWLFLSYMTALKLTSSKCFPINPSIIGIESL